MQAVNLFQLTRITDIELFPLYEQQLSHRQECLPPKKEELTTLRSFVDVIMSCSGNISQSIQILNLFYYSFTIPKISKEFDLLRIGKDYIVDIELKKSSTEDKIIKQLKQNKYYLNALCRPVHLFAYDYDNNKLYSLSEHNMLCAVGILDIYKLLQNQKDCYCDDIEDLFKASDFLISPLSTPERFLRKEYFLSSQQEEVSKRILDEIHKGSTSCFGITGAPGTGKTLLLYDLVVRLSDIGKCCVIHCGMIPEGLELLNKTLVNVDIWAAKAIHSDFEFEPYQFVLVDESHRFYSKQFDLLIEHSKEKTVIFSYDAKQILSQSEQRAQISEKIESLPGCTKFRLTNKIRTNKELASFIERLRDLHSHNIVTDYSSVKITYANDSSEAILLLENFINNGYTFINYTSSSYRWTPFDCYSSFSKGRNTHTVIGQEFEKVVMIIDNTFAYDENGKLRAFEHPNPNYLYRQLLFQGVSRVREKLAIIFVENKDAFAKALSIVSR